MFNPSYQSITFRQHIISTTQSYPCPQCSSGILEAYGLTETMKCSACDRSFVALRGGRLLCPANRLRMKIARTFWWDGLKWHWAGHTGSTNQLFAIVFMFFAPIIITNLLFAFNLMPDHPEWLNPRIANASVMFLTAALISCFCFDFGSVVKRKRTERRPALPDRPASNS